MPTKPELRLQLANAIKAGISQYQDIIAKNNAKEQNGLAKLTKTLGATQDPALTGAGGNLSAGSSTVGVPNLAQAEKKGYAKQPWVGKPKFIEPVKNNLVAKDPNGRLRLVNGKVTFVKAGVLPDGGGPGTPGGISDMNSNADAGFGASEKSMSKDEMDGDMATCTVCNGPLALLGALGNRIHTICRNCGMPHSTVQEENTEAKENVDPTVSKAVIPFSKPKKIGPGEGWITTRNNPANSHSFAFSSYQIPKDVERAKKNNTRAEYEASKVEKAESIATLRTEKRKGISGLPAPKSKMVVKTELAKVAPPGEEKLVHKLKDEYGHDKVGKEKAFATAWAIKNGTVKKAAVNDFSYGRPTNGKILPGYDATKDSKTKILFGKDPQVLHPSDKNIKKEEITPNNKKVPMTTTVVAQKVEGAKDGSEKIPEAKKTDGSGNITKGKEIAKGAMVDHIKASAAKAGVPVKEVLGFKPPKTSQAVLPASTPKFNKASIPMIPKTAMTSGVQRESKIKSGLLTPTRHTETLVHLGNNPYKGGVQSQIAAVKKPLIPMVNNSGVVAKGEYRNANIPEKGSKKITWQAIHNDPQGVIDNQRKAAKNNKIAESKAQEVEKAEPTMAKPVTKSPSSAPAAKTTAPKPSNLAPKTPKL